MFSISVNDHRLHNYMRKDCTRQPMANGIAQNWQTYLDKGEGGLGKGHCKQSSVDDLEQIKKSPREAPMVAVRMIEDDVYDKDRHNAC